MESNIQGSYVDKIKMESLVGQHDTVLANKKLPVFVTTKVKNEEEEQRCSNYMETTDSNLYITSEGVDIKLEEIDYKSINAIKKEYLGFEVEGDFNVIDNLKEECIDIAENQLDLKNEVDLEAEQAALSSIPIAVLSSNSEGQHTLLHKDTLENISSTFKTHPHVSKYTPNQGKRESPKNKKSHKVLLKCEQCSYQTICNSRLRLHMLVHKDPSELDMFKCTHCNFKTKHKSSLKKHFKLHKDDADMPKYKCISCDFVSKRKIDVIRHIRLRQKTSGNILKCEQCFYECKDPSRLNSHMRVHKDPSELDMYECTQCSFKTKHKRNLKAHSILHKDAADVPKYKCNSCDFESKRKDVLRRHIQKHQKTLGMYIQEPLKPENKKINFGKRVFKCEQCFYQCSFRSRLHSHMIVHKDPSELKMYECTQCNFKTKHKRNLRDHSILHKDAADIPRYKCNSCDFETSRKGVLIRHIRRSHNTFRHNKLGKHKPYNKKNSETASRNIFLNTKAQPEMPR